MLLSHAHPRDLVAVGADRKDRKASCLEFLKKGDSAGGKFDQDTGWTMYVVLFNDPLFEQRIFKPHPKNVLEINLRALHDPSGTNCKVTLIT